MPKTISLKKGIGENVEILEDGKRVATASASSAEGLAKQRGGTFIGFDEFKAESNGIGSSSTIRRDIRTRGEDPSKINFKSEDEFTQFKERIRPVGTEPTRGVSRVSQFEQLREKAGIEGIEDKIQESVDEQRLLEEGFEKFKTKELEGQALGFATGRITEEEKNINDRLRALQRTETNLRDRLKTKNNAIETVMTLTEKDFTESRRDYEFEFNKNLAIQSAFRQEESAQLSHDRATYNTLTNMFANSGKSFEDLNDKQKTTINEMELKIGMPTGSFEALATAKPKANVIQTGKSTDEKGNEFAWMIVQGEDGNPEIVKSFTGGFKKPTGVTDDDKKKQVDEATKFVNDNKGKSRAFLRIEMEKNFPKIDESTKNAILDEAQVEEQKVKLTTTSVNNIVDQVVDTVKGVFKSKEKEFENAIKLIDKNKTKQKWTSGQVKIILNQIKEKLEITE